MTVKELINELMNKCESLDDIVHMENTNIGGADPEVGCVEYGEHNIYLLKYITEDGEELDHNPARTAPAMN